MQWNGSTKNIFCFTNNIPQRDGGTHLAGLRALTRTLNQYIEKTGLARRKGRNQRRRCSRRLAVLSVKVPDLNFPAD
jgi:DNA gyrase subunit B